MSGLLIAFEGLDQSGKQTQAELLRDRLKQDGHKSRVVSFPDYGTSIGEEIARALQGEREYGADVMQLLYIANRVERGIRRSVRTRSAVADRDAEVSAAAGADDSPRHRPGDRGAAQIDRPRSLRAGPRAARARSREPSAAGLGRG